MIHVRSGHSIFYHFVSLDNFALGSFKQLRQRRRRRRQLQKTIGLMTETTAPHVHHAFYYISLTSTARLRRET